MGGKINSQRKAYELLLSERGKVRALDIGCGRKKFAPAVGADIHPHEGVDVVADLAGRPFPFRDGSFDLVVANHFIEHVADLGFVMTEIHRVLTPGGIVALRTPYFASFKSFKDPSHVRHLTLESMDYFTKDNPLRWRLPGIFEVLYSKLEFGTGPWQAAGRLLFGICRGSYEKNFADLFPAHTVFWALRAVK